jgi:hypothetical protein
MQSALPPDEFSNTFQEESASVAGKGTRTGVVITILVLVTACCLVFAFALFRAWTILSPYSAVGTGQDAGRRAACQELIDRALQASGDSCEGLGANQVCYGNNTLTAELNQGAQESFSDRGDKIEVGDLLRLAASPMSVDKNEWGVAVFKVIANLPRSLPGQTVSMVVFGNTTLEGASGNLESFYFTSTLGQIECDQVPFDGVVISMPDGAGVTFTANGTEIILMGDASLKATKNGSMDISILKGAASVAANGESQTIAAGQKTSLQLGGPGGTDAVGPPSAPQALSPEELSLACTMTGSFCSEQERLFIAMQGLLNSFIDQAGSGAGATPPPTSSPVSTNTFKPIPTTAVPSGFPTLIPSSTVTITFTPTITRTRTGTPTITRTPTRTRTLATAVTAGSPTATRTRTRTPVHTFTRTRTATATGTATATTTATATDDATPTMTATATDTATPTATATTAGPAAPCPGTIFFLTPLQFNNDKLEAQIRNTFGSAIRISELEVDWNDPGTLALATVELGGSTIYSGSPDPSPLSEFAETGAELDWDSGTTGARTISSGGDEWLIIDFEPDDPLTGSNSIKVTFGGTANCYIESSIP